MKPNPRNILKLSDKRYDAKEPHKNRRLDVVYSLFKRRDPLPAQTEMAFFTDTSICSGCKSCEIACKQWNMLKTTDIQWSGNSYDNTRDLSSENWRHVKFIERFSEVNETDRTAPTSMDGLLHEPKQGQWLFMADHCKHCQESPCHEACPTGAIIRNEFGGIYYQTDICMGCRMYVAACPFGVPEVSKETGHSMKCAECYDRLRDGLEPACATACTTGAIQFGPREEMVERARARLAVLHEQGFEKANLYGVDPFQDYKPLNSFYLLMDEPAVYGLPAQPKLPVSFMIGDYAKAIGMLAIAAITIVVCLL